MHVPELEDSFSPVRLDLKTALPAKCYNILLSI